METNVKPNILTIMANNEGNWPMVNLLTMSSQITSMMAPVHISPINIAFIFNASLNLPMGVNSPES